MIKVENNIAQIEGSAKEICKEFTHIIVHLINTLENDFGLSQEESLNIINECAKIAYLDDDGRAEYLKNLEKY